MICLKKPGKQNIKHHRQIWQKLFAFIKDKVHLIEDAEDILQEVWYQFSRLSNIDELESVSGWLYSVSRNKITDLYRKINLKILKI